MIIDFHTHLFPKEINPYQLSEQEPYFGYRLLKSPAKNIHPILADREKVLLEIENGWIEKMVVQGWPMERHSNCQKLNEYTLETVNNHPDKFFGFIVVNPKHGKKALKEVETYANMGLLGVGELNPLGQGFNLNDSFFLDLCDLCIELNLPISLHISEPIGPHYHGKQSPPLKDYVELAQNKPQLKIILAHFGGGLPFYELMPDLKKDLSNVFYDISFNPGQVSPRILGETIRIIGSKKILFGTNYPLIDGYKKGLQDFIKLAKEEIPQEMQSQIFYKNTLQLLNLKEGND